MTRTRLIGAAAAALALWASAAHAQTLGTFRWNVAPYCNVMVLTITQVGGFYRIEGFDEQCGGNPRQPIWGIGVPQANGTITFGLSQLMDPGHAIPVGIRVRLSPATLGGTWSDSVGSSGTLTFNPGAVSGGPRPVPPGTGLPVAPR